MSSAFLHSYLSAMEKVVAILENVDLTGFTELLSGNRLCRYVVAFTHNKERSTQLLNAQIEFYNLSYDNITIG